jgi:hypothetical protein
MELVGSLNFHHSFTWERKTQDMCIVFILPNNYHVGVHPNTSIIQVPPTIANLDLSTKKVFLSFFLSFFLFCFPPTTQSKEECVYPSISPLFFFFEIFFYLLKRFNGLDFVDDLTVMICAFWSNELTMDPPPHPTPIPPKHPLVGWVHSINSK